jgi:hypothetical protein
VQKKKALVLSPFATVPLDAGQRKRAFQTTRLLKALGYQVTFLLYAFEEGWKNAANEVWLATMREQWDEVIVWRANPKVGMPPTNGPVHDPDEWWDPAFEPMLQQLLGYRYYDLFVVHNVWLSKALDVAPKSTVRVLDSHDVFSARRGYFDRMGSAPEFFITDEKREAGAADRADIVLAIQKNDEAWFTRYSKTASLCLPYDPGKPAPPGPTRRDYLHPDKVVFGFLGSAHIFNLKGLAAYCEELKRVVGETAAPVEFRIGGAASESIRGRGPWIVCGRVPDEQQFLAGIDVVVVPVFDGSGFKVKVADAVSMGLPLLCAEHAAIGMNLSPQVLARTPAELASMTADLSLQRPKYEQISRHSEAAYLDLASRAARGASKLKTQIATRRRAIAYDLTGLTERQSTAVLLSWSGAFHLMRPYAKQFVVIPEVIRGRFDDLVPPGVFFVDESEIRAHAREVWRWTTLDAQSPLRWGARPDEIVVDEAWRSVLDDNAAVPGDDPRPALERTSFWHSITWDPLAKRILADARTYQSEGASFARGEMIYVLPADRAPALAAPLTTLFPQAGVAHIESYDDFFQLVSRLASGSIRRLAVMDTRHPVRVAMVSEICGVRGVEYVGPLGAGAFSFGRIDERIVREGYQQFEQQWRVSKPVENERLRLRPSRAKAARPTSAH